MILFLNSLFAEAGTVIVSGDQNINDTLPPQINQSIIDELNNSRLMSKSDFDKLLRLSDNLANSNENVENALALIAGLLIIQNQTNAGYENTIVGLRSELENVRGDYYDLKKDNENFENAILEYEVEFKKYKVSFWFYIGSAFVFAFIAFKLYYVLKVKNKWYFVKQAIARNFPIKVNPPDPGKADFSFKKIKW